MVFPPRPIKVIFFLSDKDSFPSTVKHREYTGKCSFQVNLFTDVYVQRFTTCSSKQLSSQHFVLIFPMWLKHHLHNSDLRTRVWSWLPRPYSEIQTRSNYHLPIQFTWSKSDSESIDQINFSASIACCRVRSPHSSLHSLSTQTADSCQLLPFGPRKLKLHKRVHEERAEGTKAGSANGI